MLRPTPTPTGANPGPVGSIRVRRRRHGTDQHGGPRPRRPSTTLRIAQSICRYLLESTCPKGHQPPTRLYPPLSQPAGRGEMIAISPLQRSATSFSFEMKGDAPGGRRQPRERGRSALCQGRVHLYQGWRAKTVGRPRRTPFRAAADGVRGRLKKPSGGLRHSTPTFGPGFLDREPQATCGLPKRVLWGTKFEEKSNVSAFRLHAKDNEYVHRHTFSHKGLDFGYEFNCPLYHTTQLQLK